MASFEHKEIIHGIEVPFKIFIERRKSVRASFGRSCINIRIPAHLSSSAKEKHLAKSIQWVIDHASKKPESLLPYKLENYDTKEFIEIYNKKINLDLVYEDRKTGRGDYNPKTETIKLLLPSQIEGQEKNKMIKQLLSRVCANVFGPDLEKRVHEINDKCFHKNIKSVNLKYNKSNWGSCSSATNLNFSTRLLFAPKPVIDYVIIHELAHLYEMNHSSRFWNIVHQVMPSYKEKEAWLKKYGSTCDF